MFCWLAHFVSFFLCLPLDLKGCAKRLGVKMMKQNIPEQVDGEQWTDLKLNAFFKNKSLPIWGA